MNTPPATNWAQIAQVLKTKLLALTQKHKTIVGDLKKKLAVEQERTKRIARKAAEKISRMQRRIKSGGGGGGEEVDLDAVKRVSILEAQVSSLEENIKLEMNKNKNLEAELNSKGFGEVDRDAMKKAAYMEAQVSSLEDSLKNEMAKVAKLEAELNSKGTSQADIESMKKVAYMEAQISSLEDSLKNEVAKSTKLAYDSTQEIHKLSEQLKHEKATNARLSEELGLATTNLKGLLAKERTTLEDQVAKLQEKHTTLAQQSETQQAQIKAQSEELVQKKREIETDLKRISQLERNLEDLWMSVKRRDQEISGLLNKISDMNSEIDSLHSINRNFNIVVFRERIDFLKNDVERLLEHSDQNILMKELEQIILLARETKKFEAKVKGQISTFLNDTNELEELVKSRLYKSEEGQ